MTVRDIIIRLQEQGHQITYYQRKDGGVLIRSIDGKKFTGASGNIVARSMVGTTLSKERSRQLQSATRTKKSLRKARGLDYLKDEWRRVREIWRKAFPPSKRKKNPIGVFGWSRILYAYHKYGYDEALRRIQEAEKYTQGIAYTKNVEELASYILQANEHYKSEDLQKLANDILENIYLIKERSIKPAYEALYDLGKRPIKEVVRKVRIILELN